MTSTEERLDKLEQELATLQQQVVTIVDVQQKLLEYTIELNNTVRGGLLQDPRSYQ